MFFGDIRAKSKKGKTDCSSLKVSVKTKFERLNTCTRIEKIVFSQCFQNTILRNTINLQNIKTIRKLQSLNLIHRYFTCTVTCTVVYRRMLLCQVYYFLSDVSFFEILSTWNYQLKKKLTKTNDLDFISLIYRTNIDQRKCKSANLFKNEIRSLVIIKREFLVFKFLIIFNYCTSLILTITVRF